MNMVEPIILGIIGTGAYGILGYLKRNDPLEQFDWKRFLRTVTIGALIGLYAQIGGVTITDAEVAFKTMSVTSFVSILVDNGLKYLERKSEKKKIIKVKTGKA